MSHSLKQLFRSTLRTLGVQDSTRVLFGQYMKLRAVGGCAVIPVFRGGLPFSTSALVCDKKINSFDFLHNRNSLGLSDKMFGNYGMVNPETVSEKRKIPAHINQPDYALKADGLPTKRISRRPGIKTREELVLMREACQIARYVMDLTVDAVKDGITTDELDKFAHDLIIRHNAYPSALGYKKFPKSICTSVNNVACHGIPDNRKLIKGDIVTIDVMAYKNGFHGDCAGTTMTAGVDQVGLDLIDAAEACLIEGVHACGPNKPFSGIGKAIEACAKLNKVTVLHVFTGHGIGRNVHEKPDVYHYSRAADEKALMLPGMTFTIEPVIAQGMDMVMVLSDGWTAVTVDGGRAAQFEHTIHITEDGIEILTDTPGPTRYNIRK